MAILFFLIKIKLMTKKNIKIIEEFYSLSGDHKAIIQSINDQFFVSIYQWNEKELDKDGLPLWEKISGPFILDSLKLAQKNAQENLGLFSLEIIDTEIDYNLIKFTRSILGHDDFQFLKSENFEIKYLENEKSEDFIKIKPTKVLHCGELCFAENNDQWICGFLESRGKIKGWKVFDNLKNALETMN